MSTHSHGSSSSSSSTMSAVFHLGNSEFILFPGFRPSDDFEFLGAVLFAFSISLISFAIGAFKRMRLFYNKVNPSPFARAERSALETIHQLFRFLMMLLIMTFNVTIFAVVLLGIFIGVYLWDPDVEYRFTKKSTSENLSSDESNSSTPDSPFLPKVEPLAYE